MSDTRQARPTRDQENRAERRRRDGVDAGLRKRLWVDETRLDHKKYVYRWANDDDARVRELTQFDDYDVVPPEEIDGSPTRHQFAAGENNTLRGAVLLRKPKEFDEEDRAKKERRKDADMESLRVGRPAQDKDDGGGLSEQHAYVPPSLSDQQDLGVRRKYEP